ncbi:MAG: DNA polymerase III subunit delta [Sutterellaceae bacterium]|nr:DNA polymerase III subunit delta [Sutterellaceae bacterium]
MAIRFQDLERHIRAEPQPLWVITGEEPLLMLEAADLLRQKARAAGYTERTVLNASAVWNWSELFESCQAMSLFGDKKIVELRLASAKPGTKGAQALTDVAQMPLDGVMLIITIPYDYSVKKLAWWKALTGAAEVVECQALTARELPSFFKERLAKNKQTAEPDAIRILCERCEGNLLAASQEILKLAYRHPEGAVITAADVEQTVSDVSRFDTDNLLEAIAAADAAKAVRIVENLRAKAEPIPSLMWLLTDEIRTMLKVRGLMDKGMRKDDAIQKTNIWPAAKKFRMSKALTRHSTKKLANAMLLAADIDRISKGLFVADRDSDPWLEILSLVAFLAR